MGSTWGSESGNNVRAGGATWTPRDATTDNDANAVSVVSCLAGPLYPCLHTFPKRRKTQLTSAGRRHTGGGRCKYQAEERGEERPRCKERGGRRNTKAGTTQTGDGEGSRARQALLLNSALSRLRSCRLRSTCCQPALKLISSCSQPAHPRRAPLKATVVARPFCGARDR